MRKRLFALLGVLVLPAMLSACAPSRDGPASDSPAAVDLAVGPPPDLAPSAPDLGYICGQYANYQARLSGVVRSPCDYDVSKVLSIGGNVKTKINPPTISMEFPDGTFFAGQTDGKTFTATRISTFPYTDGCTWRATETLQGTIDTQGSCQLSAVYSYREAPITAPPCALACTIDAQVIIARVSIILG